jgi:hypothetical protein
MAENDKEYEAEIASINENFEEAIKIPFYADEINSFKLVATENDGFETVYTCVPAIVFAIVGGVMELILIGLTCASFVFYKKSRVDE